MKKIRISKKIATILTATALITSTFAMTAFAAPADEKGVTTGDALTSISFTKDLKLVDEDSSFTPTTPNVKFAYTLAPAADADVTGVVKAEKKSDDTVVQAGVKKGIVEAIKTQPGNAEFSPADVATNKVVSKTMTIEFDASKFTAAGIYRYVLTEGDPDNSNVSKTDKQTRYIDVYVTDKDNDETPEITGTVVTKPGTSGKVLKTDGFTDDYDEYTEDPVDKTLSKTGEGTADSGVSTYNTYDLKVSKEVKGDLGDKTYKFNFNTTFTTTDETANNQGIILSSFLNGTGEAAPIAFDASKTIVFNSKLKHGEYVIIKGIPADNVSYTVDEAKHEVDSYVVTAKAFADADASLADTTLKDSSDGKTTAALKINKKAGKNEVDFTNTLDNVAPTGLVLKLMPYVIMVVFAAVMEYIFLGRRKEIK